MTILITGAAGFCGRYLVDYFAQQGHVIVAVSRDFGDIKPDDSDAVKYVVWNIKDGLPDVGQVDVIIHTAAAHPAARVMPSDQDFFDYNLEAMRKIKDYCAEKRVKKFVHLSTVSVYGKIESDILTEDTLPNEPDLYGQTKKQGEDLFKEIRDITASIHIRLPGVVGKGCFKPWLGKVFQKAIRGEEIVYAHPDAFFNNVVDRKMLADFIDHVLIRGLSGWNIINLAAGEKIIVKNLIQLIVNKTGSTSSIREQQTSKRPFFISIDKLRKEFNYTPAKTKKIVSEYIEENLILI